MSAKLPFRMQEVLAALVQNPDGLTTKQIYEHTKRNVGTEVLNEKAVSNIIYSTRQVPPAYTISRSTDKGMLIFITPAGKQRLEESMTDDDRHTLFGERKPDPDFEKLSAAEIATAADTEQQATEETPEQDIELEAALTNLRNLIKGRSRQRLPNHHEIIDLLRECENNEIFDPKKRALFAYARFGLE